MIRHQDNQVILSGRTAKAFAHKLNNPNKDTMVNRERYFREIQTSLSVKTVNGKIIIK